MFFAVAYNSDEVLYIWSNPKKGVDYEEKLQLSQFEIKQTAFRGLNFSRGTTSEQSTNIHQNQFIRTKTVFDFRGRVFCVASGHCTAEAYGVFPHSNLLAMHTSSRFVMGRVLAQQRSYIRSNRTW